MIKKIDTCKIKYRSNTEKFVSDCNNLMQSIKIHYEDQSKINKI
jgi:hypothetical protein